MTKRTILLTFLYACAFRSQAQFKFGLAAGYEHITSTPNDNTGSGGGFSGSLLFQYSFSEHIELDMAWTGGGWKASTDAFNSPRSGLNPGSYLEGPGAGMPDLSSGILLALGQNVGFRQYLARNTCRHSC
jgi:hypothetical protein